MLSASALRLAPPSREVSQADELVSSAGDALTHVARLLSPFDGETAAEASARTAQLEAQEEGPFVLAVAGDDEAARAIFLNLILDEPLVDPVRQAPAGARTRFQRGPELEYRARLRSGEEEVFSALAGDRTGEVVTSIAMASRDIESSAVEVGRLERALARHAPWLPHAERTFEVWEGRVARAREAVEAAKDVCWRLDAELTARRKAVESARPSWWGRVVGWVAPERLRAVREAEEAVAEVEGRYREAEARAAGTVHALGHAEDDQARRGEPITQARLQKTELEAALASARREHRRAVRRREKLEADLAAQIEARRQAFRDAVRALTDAGARAGEVESLVVEVPSPTLPDGVVLVDLGGRDGHGNAIDLKHGRAVCRRYVDGCVWVGAGEPPRDLLALFLHVTAVGPSPRAAALTRLCQVKGRHRSLAAGRSALEAVRAASAALDQIEVRAQAAGRARVERLDALRIFEPSDLVEKAVRGLSGAVHERVELALRHAVDQLAWEIDRLCAEWMKLLRACSDLDAMRRLVAKLGRGAPLALRAVEREVQRRLLSALAGGAHDLHAAASSGVRGRLREALAVLAEPPTPGGSSHHRGRLRLGQESLAQVQQALVGEALVGAQLGMGLQPLARSLLGARASTLFDGLAGGMAARLRGLTAVREESLATLRERMVALHQAADADLLAAEPELARLLNQELERAPARAALELDRALDALARAESAGLEHDLAHLRGVLAGVRQELGVRQEHLRDRIDALGREIDGIVQEA